MNNLPYGAHLLHAGDTVKGTDLVYWPIGPRDTGARRWTPINLLDAKDCYMVDTVGDAYNPSLHLTLARHS